MNLEEISTKVELIIIVRDMLDYIYIEKQKSRFTIKGEVYNTRHYINYCNRLLKTDLDDLTNKDLEYISNFRDIRNHLAKYYKG